MFIELLIGRPAGVVGTGDAGGPGTTEGAKGGGSGGGGSGVSDGETSDGEAFAADGASSGEGAMLDEPDEPGGGEGAEALEFLPSMSLKTKKGASL